MRAGDPLEPARQSVTMPPFRKNGTLYYRSQSIRAELS
jgi:hypothetical protein